MITHPLPLDEVPFYLHPVAPNAAAMPPAFWRLISIGKAAGLTHAAAGSADPCFGETAARMRASVSRLIAEFHYSATEFYLLVTLFDTAPHPTDLEALARETLADTETLGVALERLHAEQAIEPESEADLESPVVLTPTGRSLALLLMYRVFRAGVPGDSRNQCPAR
jgi:hypothetical protein